MDYRFRPEEEAFRTEVRTFLTSELPPDWDYDPFELFDEVWEFAKGFTKKLAQKGWIAPAWPKQYGGEDLPFMKQVVLSEELAYYRAPNTGYIGVTYAGPTMIVYGTEEQKKEFIPGILSGDIIWCQGYSEPNAGSDLASLETRAVRDGDDYVINGTKIWSSNAHKANWCFLLARTDMDAPKHKGISYFVTPMDAPGISTRPLVNMADEHVFNEIVFDNVRIPAKYRVGEENRGWYIGMTTLDFERSNISSAAQYRRTLETLTEYVKEHGNGANGSRQGPRRDPHGAGRPGGGERGGPLPLVPRGEHAGARPDPELRVERGEGLPLGVRAEAVGPGPEHHGHVRHAPRRLPLRAPARPLRAHLRDQRRRDDRRRHVGGAAQHHREPGTGAEPGVCETLVCLQLPCWGWRWCWSCWDQHRRRPATPWPTRFSRRAPPGWR